MTPKIKECFKRADLVTFGGKPCIFGEEDAEKFARSIIAECIEAIRLVPYAWNGPEFGDEVKYQQAIYDHFKENE